MVMMIVATGNWKVVQENLSQDKITSLAFWAVLMLAVLSTMIKNP